jgi:hypothetical protein
MLKLKQPSRRCILLHEESMLKLKLHEESMLKLKLPSRRCILLHQSEWACEWAYSSSASRR